MTKMAVATCEACVTTMVAGATMGAAVTITMIVEAAPAMPTTIGEAAEAAVAMTVGAVPGAIVTMMSAVRRAVRAVGSEIAKVMLKRRGKDGNTERDLVRGVGQRIVTTMDVPHPAPEVVTMMTGSVALGADTAAGPATQRVIPKRLGADGKTAADRAL